VIAVNSVSSDIGTTCRSTSRWSARFLAKILLKSCDGDPYLP